MNKLGYEKQEDEYIKKLMGKWVKIDHQGNSYIGKLREYNSRITLEPTLTLNLPLSKKLEENVYEIIEEPIRIDAPLGPAISKVTDKNLEFLLGHKKIILTS